MASGGLSLDTVQKFSSYAASHIRRRGDLFEIEPTGLFDWIPLPRVHRDSLFGVSLLPLLKIFSDDHDRPVCECHRRVLMWNYHVKDAAESHGWTATDMAMSLYTLTNVNYYFLLEDAFFSFSKAVGIDLSSPKETVRCEKILAGTPEALVSDEIFKRVICKYTGGWILVKGPAELRRDKDFLLDILSADRCDPAFLHKLDRGFLLDSPEIALRWPQLMDKCEVFATEVFCLKVLALDHRFSSHIRRSLMELPKVAGACGRSFLRRFEEHHRPLVDAYFPKYPVDDLLALLRGATTALEEFGFRQEKPNSKLRNAALDYASALAGFSCFEPWDDIFKACQKIKRLLCKTPSAQGETCEADTRGGRKEGSGGEVAFLRTSSAEDQSQEKSKTSKGPEETKGAHEQRNPRSDTDISLEIEVQKANQSARIEKLSHPKKPPSSPKKKTKKFTRKVCGSDEEDTRGTKKEPEKKENEKKPSAALLEARGAPFLISDKPLDELLQASERSGWRADRKLRKKEGWLKKREEQQEKLASVFL
jgi:hypothetical protein